MRNSHRGYRATIPLVVAALSLGMGNCRVDPGFDPRASVPEAASRLEYALPADSAATDSVFQTALEQTVCLLQTGEALRCREPAGTRRVCNNRTDEEIATVLKPLFSGLRRLGLHASLALSAAIRDSIPDAVATQAVDDARRSLPCHDWGGDRTCIAIYHSALWLLLTGPAPGQRFDRMDIFLAADPCLRG